jgi:hypothetical protein
MVASALQVHISGFSARCLCLEHFWNDKFSKFQEKITEFQPPLGIEDLVTILQGKNKARKVRGWINRAGGTRMFQLGYFWEFLYFDLLNRFLTGQLYSLLLELGSKMRLSCLARSC